jgi:S1-C subfamily serine protease
MNWLRLNLILPVTFCVLSSTAAATKAPSGLPNTESPKLPIAPKVAQPPKTKVSPSTQKKLSAPILVFGLDAKKLSAVIRGAKVGSGLGHRGAKEQEIYAKFSGSVVLIVTQDGIGSGSVVSKDGLVLTNWHVIGDERQVAVLFKPLQEGDVPDTKLAVRGTVIKVDEVADLAIIKLSGLPQNLLPIQVAKLDDVRIGEDVHAIGHPIGETWSYTKGLVSQVRKGYTWTSDNYTHKADVIQTQTPISPGNSGGPLLDDLGNLVGVNAFKAVDGDDLNFAISAKEVRIFMAAKDSRFASQSTKVETPPHSGASEPNCEIATLGQGKLKNGDSFTSYDLDCDGKQDAAELTPLDRANPSLLLFDLDHNRIAERTYFDRDRDGVADFVTYDTDQDGKADLLGTELDAKLQPKSVRPLG